ncbi:MAG: amidohydrolase family protein [Clostridia bacterium]
MIIDIHAHTWFATYLEDRRSVLSACSRHGFDRVYISTLGVYNPSPKDIAAYNAITHGFMEENPGLIRGFVTVDPVHPDCLEVFKQGIFRQGMEGVKIWVSCLCDDPRVNPLAEACIREGLPLLIHAFKKATGQLPFETTGVHVRSLALRYPELKIIMAHMGGDLYHGLRCIDDLPNVWTDISGTLCGNDDMQYAMGMVGEGRILFGTDMPASPHAALARVEGSGLGDAARERIYYRNALEILERKGR